MSTDKSSNIIPSSSAHQDSREGLVSEDAAVDGAIDDRQHGSLFDDLEKEITCMEQVIGCHMSQVDIPTETVDALCADALRVMEKALELTGDMERVAIWYRTESLTQFGGKTPQALVTERRTEDLIMYLVAAGIF